MSDFQKSIPLPEASPLIRGSSRQWDMFETVELFMASTSPPSPSVVKVAPTAVAAASPPSSPPSIVKSSSPRPRGDSSSSSSGTGHSRTSPTTVRLREGRGKRGSRREHSAATPPSDVLPVKLAALKLPLDTIKPEDHTQQHLRPHSARLASGDDVRTSPHLASPKKKGSAPRVQSGTVTSRQEDNSAGSPEGGPTFRATVGEFRPSRGAPEKSTSVGSALFGGKKKATARIAKSKNRSSVMLSSFPDPPLGVSSEPSLLIRGSQTLRLSGGRQQAPISSLDLQALDFSQPGPLSPVAPESREAFYQSLMQRGDSETSPVRLRLSHSGASASRRTSVAATHGGGGGGGGAFGGGSASTGGSFGAGAQLAKENDYREELKIFQALDLFNQSPVKGLLSLVSVGLVTHSPPEVASFFCRCTYLSKKAIGDFLSEPAEFHQQCCTAFLQLLDLRFLDFDLALRRLLTHVGLPGEAQRIDRLMRGFAHQYYMQNMGPAGGTHFKGEKAVHSLAFALIMLNTDAHSPNVLSKMSLSQFNRNLQGFNEGGDFPAEFLGELYTKITLHEIKLTEETERFPHAVKTGWLQVKPRGTWSMWNRRWIVLSDNTIYLLKTPTSTHPLLVIPLVEIHAAPLSKSEARGRPFAILLHQPPNTSSPSSDLPVHLAGTSDFDVHQWIRAIDQFSKASPQSSSLPSSVLPKSSSSYI